MSCLQNFLNRDYDRIQELCRRQIRGNGDDLCNDICLSLLETADIRMEEMCKRGEIWYYVVRIINISAFSKTSKYYYKYKKHTEFERVDITMIQYAEAENIYSEEGIKYQLKTLNLILRELEWFDSELFKAYFLHSHSLKTLSDATKISKTTIQKSISKSKAYIKKEVERLGGFD